MPNAGTSNQVKTYSLASPVPGTTGSGLDQFVDFIYADNGLAERPTVATSRRAAAANSPNQLIIEAAMPRAQAPTAKVHGRGGGGDEPVPPRQPSRTMDDAAR